MNTQPDDDDHRQTFERWLDNDEGLPFEPISPEPVEDFWEGKAPINDSVERFARNTKNPDSET